ncbi:MAG: site-2 protease family protein [Candidatus Shapirobacteria bacterium]|jgi:Zn-dependent protease|nr:site-2 protease family protein [Candidatus Shapirobacteria bacterium]
MVNIISLIISVIALIIAITIHEFSHALTADRLGDPTPRSQGRLTLNPLRHLDLVGTIMIFLVHFGWGKPVQIDPYNLKNPKRDELLISLAGPASNLILAALLSLIIRFVPLNDLSGFLIYTIIQLNVLLAIFNLIPIPPLDGSKIFLNLLPNNISTKWQEAFNQYGFILLIIFLFLPIINGETLISVIITPIMSVILNFLI